MCILIPSKGETNERVHTYRKFNCTVRPCVVPPSPAAIFVGSPVNLCGWGGDPLSRCLCRVDLAASLPVFYGYVKLSNHRMEEDVQGRPSPKWATRWSMVYYQTNMMRRPTEESKNSRDGYTRGGPTRWRLIHETLGWQLPSKYLVIPVVTVFCSQILVTLLTFDTVTGKISESK